MRWSHLEMNSFFGYLSQILARIRFQRKPLKRKKQVKLYGNWIPFFLLNVKLYCLFFELLFLIMCPELSISPIIGISRQILNSDDDIQYFRIFFFRGLPTARGVWQLERQGRPLQFWVRQKLSPTNLFSMIY